MKPSWYLTGTVGTVGAKLIPRSESSFPKCLQSWQVYILRYVRSRNGYSWNDSQSGKFDVDVSALCVIISISPGS